jgi:flagellar hook-associated protein 1 FlgK
MPDLLSIASTGIAVSQTAINVTGQNIANVSSTGYTREKLDQTSATVGQGAQILGISRVYNQFLAAQANAATTANSSSSIQYNQIQSLNGILTDPNAGISPAMSNFFNSLQDVSNSPSDIAPRQSAIGSAQNLVSSMNYLQSTIDNINIDINTQLAQSVSRINQYADQIVTLNKAIVGTKDQATLNSLKDQRDTVVNLLSKEVSVSVSSQNSEYLVTVGSGVPLLDSTKSFPVKLTTNPFNAGQSEVVISGTNNSIFTSKNSPGGIVGGLINFRSNILNPATNNIGLVALGLTTEINNAQTQGSSLKSVTPPTGTALFDVGDILVKGNLNNTSPNSITVVFNSSLAANPGNPLAYLKNVTTSDYTFAFDGTNYSLTRNSDGNVITSPTANIDADGMKISIPNGAIAAGDSFRISPTANAARNFSLLTNDPLSFAAAASGAATPSDVKSGDNTNMINLLRAQTNTNLNSGSNTITTLFNQFVSNIGSQSHALKVQNAFDESVSQKSSQALENDSGVNLDEEAANLIRFQQAYQASGKVMQIAKQMFDSILNIAQ